MMKVDTIDLMISNIYGTYMEIFFSSSRLDSYILTIINPKIKTLFFCEVLYSKIKEG